MNLEPPGIHGMQYLSGCEYSNSFSFPASTSFCACLGVPQIRELLAAPSRGGGLHLHGVGVQRCVGVECRPDCQRFAVEDVPIDSPAVEMVQGAAVQSLDLLLVSHGHGGLRKDAQRLGGGGGHCPAAAKRALLDPRTLRVAAATTAKASLTEDLRDSQQNALFVRLRRDSSRGQQRSRRCCRAGNVASAAVGTNLKARVVILQLRE
jgi:hypothetical protein